MYENELRPYVGHRVTLTRMVKVPKEQDGFLSEEDGKYYFTPVNDKGRPMPEEKAEVDLKDVKAVIQSDFDNPHHREDFENLLGLAAKSGQRSEEDE